MRLIDWSNTEVLITGGTGSLGKTITRLLLTKYKPKGIRIFSRDELKQWTFRNELEKEGYDKNISWLIGDVRDKNRIDRALHNVNLVFNTAAMKQVPACEYNPFEAVATNIKGAENIIEGAIDNRVNLAMHVSTDKAVYPVNLYGATKTVAEKLFLHGNVYTGGHGTKFSVCRYGNVIGSRGSIIPLFLEQAKTGTVTLTNYRMTRFWITLNEVANFIISKAEITKGNEVFIPIMPSIKIIDLIDAMFPFYNSEVEFLNYPIDDNTRNEFENRIHLKVKEIGIRKGEKLHECLMTAEESYFSSLEDNAVVIRPEGDMNNEVSFTYSSDKNKFLFIEEIKELVKPFMEGAQYV
jgi:FlaA1/EpsC-like NDP-sugar epimerase